MATLTITYPRRIGKPLSQRINEARALLAAEARRAQKLLTAESRRQHLEAVNREAFYIPADMTCMIVETLAPEGASYDEFIALHNRVEEHFKAAGWIVGRHTNNPAYKSKEREKLRKLYELTESGLAGQFRASLDTLLLAIDDLHANMLVNQKRNFYDRIPAPCLAYSLPSVEEGVK